MQWCRQEQWQLWSYKHTVNIPGESNDREWTLFHSLALSVSVSSSSPLFLFFSVFPFPINNCQSLLFFHADRDEVKLKHRMPIRRDMGKGGAGVHRLWNTKGWNFFKGRRGLVLVVHLLKTIDYHASKLMFICHWLLLAFFVVSMHTSWYFKGPFSSNTENITSRNSYF